MGLDHVYHYQTPSGSQVYNILRTSTIETKNAATL